MNSIGERIYELRKQNNMSQGDLADKLDVSRQTISKWENNSSLPKAYFISFCSPHGVTFLKESDQRTLLISVR